MRILLLTSSFPPRLGGVETYLTEVAVALAGHDVTILAPADTGDDAIDRALPARVVRYEPALPGYLAGGRALLATRTVRGGGSSAGRPAARTIFLAAANRTMLRRAAAQAMGLAELAGEPFDLALAGTVLPSGLLARVLFERTGLHYGVFAHGAELLVFRGARLRALLTRVLEGAACVAAVSRFTAAIVEGLGVPRARIAEAQPGIDAAAFLEDGPALAGRAAAFRSEHGLDGRRVILTHGRLDPRKGHDVVIRALAETLRTNRDVVYLVTGGGQEEGALKTLAARLGVEGSVVFTGPIAPEDVPVALAVSEIFVMANRRIGTNVEGFGIVCLEAAAAGKPVIAGQSGGVADAVADGETGWLVDGEQVEAVREALTCALADPARARAMGEAGRRRVLERFDRRAFAARVLGVVESGDVFSPSGRERSPAR